MKTVSTNLRRLYMSDRAKTDQPYRSLEVEFLQGTVPDIDETVILEDGNLRIGVQAKVIEHLGDKKVNALVPMREIYSLDPNAGVPEGTRSDPYFYTPSRQNVATEGVNPYSSFSQSQNTANSAPRADAKIVKSFSVSALLALALSALCLSFFFFWKEYVGTFLLLNSPLEGLFYFAAEEVRNVDFIKFAGWVIALSPFLAVILCWRHWSEDGDAITGLLGSVTSSLAAGASSLLLFAIMAMRGWFGDLFSGSPSSNPDGSEWIASSDYLGLIIWLSVSAVWFLIILTGMNAKK